MTYRRTDDDVPIQLKSWVTDITRLNRVELVPGREFFFTRDLIVYPSQNFLATGMLALCGMSMRPDLAARPFLSGLVLSFDHMDTRLYNYYRFMSSEWVRQCPTIRRHIYTLATYVAHLAGVPGGSASGTGAVLYERHVSRGTLPRISK